MAFDFSKCRTMGQAVEQLVTELGGLSDIKEIRWNAAFILEQALKRTVEGEGLLSIGDKLWHEHLDALALRKPEQECLPESTL